MLNPAKLLLEDLYELHAINPDHHAWDVDTYPAGTYNFYLIMRIHALLDALSLKMPFEFLFYGDFLASGKIDLQKLFLRSDRLKQAFLNDRRSKGEIPPRDLPALFERILDHSLRINTALKINAGVLAASGIHRISVNYTNAISEEIWDIAKDEFAILQYLLNPDEILITKQGLIDQYGYPDVDMEQLYYDDL